MVEMSRLALATFGGLEPFFELIFEEKRGMVCIYEKYTTLTTYKIRW